jgi:hypothetical protein
MFYLREMERQGVLITYRFIDKTNALNLSRLIPAHWKSSFKACIFSGSYQTTVFEVRYR